MQLDMWLMSVGWCFFFKFVVMCKMSHSLKSAYWMRFHTVDVCERVKMNETADCLLYRKKSTKSNTIVVYKCKGLAGPDHRWRDRLMYLVRRVNLSFL